MKWMALLVGGLILIFGVAAGILAVMGGLDNHGVGVETVEIEAPPEYVFKWVSEPSYTTRWVRRLKSAKKITKGALKVESLVREVITTPNGNYELTGTCKTHEPGEKFEIDYTITGWTPKGKKLEPRAKGDEPILNINSSFELSGEETTTLTYKVSTDYGPWYMRLMEPMSTHTGHKMMISNLEDLKSRSEGEWKREKERKKKSEEKRKARQKKKADKKAKKAETSGTNPLKSTKPGVLKPTIKPDPLDLLQKSNFKPVRPEKP